MDFPYNSVPTLPVSDLSTLRSMGWSRSSNSPSTLTTSSPSTLPSMGRSLSFPCNPPLIKDLGSTTVAAAASSSLPKVCITTGGIVGDGVGYHFYLVDLNNQGCWYKAGEIGDDSSAICVVGYRVYTFEAENVNKFDKDRRDVCSYRLSANSDDASIGKQEYLCKMVDTKFCPQAVAAPDGSKILVYASAIRPFHDNNSKRCDFELFDINKKKCVGLPKLQPWRSWERKTKTASVRSAFFRSALLVLLETRVYSLKLEDERSVWEPRVNVLDDWVPMGTPFEMLGDNTYLTPFKAYDDRHPGCAFTYPDLSSYPDGISGPLYPMLLDSSVPDQVDFCILHAGAKLVEDFRSEPNYIIDVYRCDLKEKERKMKMKMKEEQKKEEEEQRKTKKQKREEEELPGTTKSNSLNFSLDKDDTFLLRYCRFTPIIHNSR